MHDTTRAVLIALGVALIAVVLLPVLFMGGMMGGWMIGGGTMVGAAWILYGLPVLVVVAGAVLLVFGLRRP